MKTTEPNLAQRKNARRKATGELADERYRRQLAGPYKHKTQKEQRTEREAEREAHRIEAARQMTFDFRRFDNNPPDDRHRSTDDDGTPVRLGSDGLYRRMPFVGAWLYALDVLIEHPEKSDRQLAAGVGLWSYETQRKVRKMMLDWSVARIRTELRRLSDWEHYVERTAVDIQAAKDALDAPRFGADGKRRRLPQMKR